MTQDCLKCGVSRSLALLALFLSLFAVAASMTLQAQSGVAIRRDLAHQRAQPATKVGRYRLQSNPWVNLHQRLLHEARFKSTPPTALSGDDLSKWKKAVETYRAFLGKRSPIFDDELIHLNATLSKTSTPELPDSIPEAASTVLKAAMPLYRSVQWEEDDRANRFWIAIAEAMLASAAEELADAHAKVYAMPFPKHILVDVSPFAWEFDAYTVGQGGICPCGHLEHGPGKSGLRRSRDTYA